MFSKLVVFFAVVTFQTAHMQAVVKVFDDNDPLYNAHNCKEKFHLESHEAAPFNLNSDASDNPSFSSVEQCVQWIKIGSRKFFGMGTQGELKASNVIDNSHVHANKKVSDILKHAFKFVDDEVLTFEDAQQQILNLDQKGNDRFLVQLGDILPMHAPAGEKWGMNWGVNWERIAYNYVIPLCMWKKFTLPSCRAETFMDSHLGSVVAYVYKHPNPRDSITRLGVTRTFLNLYAKTCIQDFWEGEVETSKYPCANDPVMESWRGIMSHLGGMIARDRVSPQNVQKVYDRLWDDWKATHALNVHHVREITSLPHNDLRMIQTRWESKCFGTNWNVLGNILTWIHKKIMSQNHGLDLDQIVAATSPEEHI